MQKPGCESLKIWRSSKKLKRGHDFEQCISNYLRYLFLIFLYPMPSLMVEMNARNNIKREVLEFMCIRNENLEFGGNSTEL